MYLQLTTSVVGILDGISDWPEDVVQEQSSAYVFNDHLQLCTTTYELGVLYMNRNTLETVMRFVDY